MIHTGPQPIGTSRWGFRPLTSLLGAWAPADSLMVRAGPVFLGEFSPLPGAQNQGRQDGGGREGARGTECGLREQTQPGLQGQAHQGLSALQTNPKL